MNVDDFARDAARTADAAVRAVLDSHAKSELHDEDDVNSGIVGGLKVAFAAKGVRGFSWSASVLRHRRGVAAEEKRVGADILIHVALNTPDLSYSKGILIQAKNAGPNDALSQTDLKRLSHSAVRCWLELQLHLFLATDRDTCVAALPAFFSETRIQQFFIDVTGHRIAFFLNYFGARSATLEFAARVLSGLLSHTS